MFLGGLRIVATSYIGAAPSLAFHITYGLFCVHMIYGLFCVCLFFIWLFSYDIWLFSYAIWALYRHCTESHCSYNIWALLYMAVYCLYRVSRPGEATCQSPVAVRHSTTVTRRLHNCGMPVDPPVCVFMSVCVYVCVCVCVCVWCGIARK